MTEMASLLTNVRGRLHEKDDQIANLQELVNSLLDQQRVKEQEINELEITLSEAQQTLIECSRKHSPDWIISRDQIQVTDTYLGEGAWGRVVEGSLRIDDFPGDDDVSILEVVYAYTLPDVALFRASS